MNSLRVLWVGVVVGILAIALVWATAWAWGEVSQGVSYVVSPAVRHVAG